MADAVRLDTTETIATITLNQPEKRNALSADIKTGLHDALDELGDTARCLVVRGAGDAFCAGGDIDAMHARFENDTPPEDRVRDLGPDGNVIYRLATYPAPTIAKIDGPVVGAGISLALANDIQLASDRSVFGIVFRNVGLSVDAGASYFLPRVTGTNIAKELAYTGEIFDADRALDLGIVNHVYPTAEFDDRADELIEQIATGPTIAMKYSKQLIDDGMTKTLGEALADEATAGGIVYTTNDHEEGVQAFLDDRSPAFDGT